MNFKRTGIGSRRQQLAGALSCLVLAIVVAAIAAAPENLADLQAAANQNNPEAQYKLGLAHESGLGTPANPAEAANWYRRAAQAKHAKAQMALGFLYSAGAGVKQDWREAVKYFQWAADAGLPEAQHKLGFCYLRGLGVDQDDQQAFACYKKAAELGVLEAQLQVGEMYYDGWGVEQDYTQAFQWIQKAALRGLPQAQYRLGSFYLLGQGGVQRDLVEAHKWFILALPLGRDDAHKLRDKMATLYRLTPEQIAESFQRAKAFQPGP